MDPVPSADRPAADVVRFHRLWDEHAARVRSYARRLVDVDAADEVVSETFLIAWRRLNDVPEAALPWLLVVAKNCAANVRRSAGRQSAVQGEMARLHHLVEAVPGVDVGVTTRGTLLEALAQLSAIEREALLLTGWEGLSARQAAKVAGCSASAMHVRLFRARRRLREATTGDEDEVTPPGSVIAEPQPAVSPSASSAVVPLAVVLRPSAATFPAAHRGAPHEA